MLSRRRSRSEDDPRTCGGVEGGIRVAIDANPSSLSRCAVRM